MPSNLRDPRIIKPNPLAYPAGAVPGIDFSHPASKGLGLSAAFANGFVNTAPGVFPVKATVSGTPGYAVDGIAGPLKDVGTSFYYDFASSGTWTLNDLTLAAIIRPLNASSNSGIIGLGNGGTHIASLNTFTPNTLWFDNGSSDNSSGLALSLAPYFVVASLNRTTFALNFLTKNLATGQVQTVVTASSPGGGSTVTDCFIGREIEYSTNYDGRIAAVMASSAFLTMPQLLAWAKSPWEFWYPNKTINLVNSAGAAATFLAAWAGYSNRPVIGTGNY